MVATLVFDTVTPSLFSSPTIRRYPHRGVLPRQSADQLDGLVGNGRTPWTPVRVGLSHLHERTVPAKDRLRRDEERTPALARHEASEEGERCSVGPGEAWAGDLTTKHGQLVAEHKNLGILRRAI
jgi:hypothetical protein